MRTLFGGQRLTKDVDLDFINPKRTADSLHNTISRAISAAAQGLPIQAFTVSSPRKTERIPRWKINFTDTHGEPYHVEVEISRDTARAVPGTVIQKPFAPEAAKGIARFWVDIYDQPSLIASKLAALLGREAPRDIYDLDLLLHASPPPTPEQVQWAIRRAGLHEEKSAIQLLRTRLNASTWERFQSELRDSLPDEEAERIDEAE